MKGKMKHFIIVILFALTLCSCGKDNENITTPPADATFDGTWKADEVQILNSPNNQSGVWKDVLVLWGSINATTAGSMEITFQTNGLWFASGFLTNSIIKELIKDNDDSSSYSANGRYTKSANSYTINVDNYTGRHTPATGNCTGSYSISGDKMTMTIDLPDNEKWQIIFKKQ